MLNALLLILLKRFASFVIDTQYNVQFDVQYYVQSGGAIVAMGRLTEQ